MGHDSPFLHPLGNTGFGARVTGLDLHQPLPTRTIDWLQHALLQYSVLLIEQQHLDQHQLLQFTRYFGEVDARLSRHTPAGIPRQQLLYSDERRQPTLSWLADAQTLEQPADTVIIQAHDQASDHLFASTRTAYARLTPALQQLIDGLDASLANLPLKQVPYVHDSYHSCVQPLVRRHPQTGQPGLWASPRFNAHVQGLAPHESNALLALLFAHQAAAEHTLHCRLQPGSIAIRDNRNTLHREIRTTDGHAASVSQTATLGLEQPTAWRNPDV